MVQTCGGVGGEGWVVLGSPLPCHLSDPCWPQAWDPNLLFKPHVYSYPSSVLWFPGSEANVILGSVGLALFSG